MSAPRRLFTAATNPFQPKMMLALRKLEDISLCKRATLQELDIMVRDFLHLPSSRADFYIALKKIETAILSITLNVHSVDEKDALKIGADEMRNYLTTHFGIAGHYTSLTLSSLFMAPDYSEKVNHFATLIALEKTLQQHPDSDAFQLINGEARLFSFENNQLFTYLLGPKLSLVELSKALFLAENALANSVFEQLARDHKPALLSYNPPGLDDFIHLAIDESEQLLERLASRPSPGQR